MGKHTYKVKSGCGGFIPTSGKPYKERTQADLKAMYEHGGPIHKLYIERVEVKEKPKTKAKKEAE